MSFFFFKVKQEDVKFYKRHQKVGLLLLVYFFYILYFHILLIHRKYILYIYIS